jgi:hypothetical protein
MVRPSSLSSSLCVALKQTFKRDYLINLEKTFQKKWQDEKVFEINAPTVEELGGKDLTPKEIQEQAPKWMGTFPYVPFLLPARLARGTRMLITSCLGVVATLT